MKKRHVVVCPEYHFESHPMSKHDAEEAVDSPEPIHPFQGACRSSHYVAEY